MLNIYKILVTNSERKNLPNFLRAKSLNGVFKKLDDMSNDIDICSGETFTITKICLEEEIL